MLCLATLLTVPARAAEGVVLLAQAALPTVILNRKDLWLLAGFILLGWSLARMTVNRRRKMAAQNRENNEAEQRLAADRKTSLPLSDAPIETQRWQIALFDLQRELKGELDSRISIIQMLMRQVDEKIARLESLKEDRP